jgi:hypothetical protein
VLLTSNEGHESPLAINSTYWSVSIIQPSLIIFPQLLDFASSAPRRSPPDREFHRYKITVMVMMLMLERTRRMNMFKVVCTAAVIAVTAALALTGTARAGMSVNGTSLKGQTLVAGSSEVVGLVLPNGAAVSVR